MYMLMPATFDSLWPRLQFQIPTDGRGNFKHDATRTDYGQLLFRAVNAYLMGEGHPNHPTLPEVIGLTASQIHEERHDPHLRARLLLFAVMNKARLPSGRTWKITVSRSCSIPHWAPFSCSHILG